MLKQLILLLKLLLKNNLSTEQTASEWACSECTKESTVLLVESRELVMRIMYSISILVALETSNLIANNSVLEVVVLLAEAFKEITLVGLQKCTAEIVYIFLRDIALASVTTIRVKKEKKTSKQR